MVSVHPARRRGVVPVGLGDGVGHCHDVANHKESVFLFPFCIFFWKKMYSVSKGMVPYFCVLLDMLVAKREPTPCYRDAYSVGTPGWAFWEKGWQKHCKTMFSPLFGRFFLVSKRTFFWERVFFMDVPYWQGQASWAWSSVFHTWSAVG